MASTYSNLKIELIGTGEQTNTWGATTNTNLGTAIEEAIAESADVSFSSADVTLTLTNSNSSQTARNVRLNLTGTSGGARTLTVPDIEKPYIINNGLADTVTVQNSTGSTVAVPAGKTMWVYSTGAGVKDVTTYASSMTLGSALPVASGGTGLTSPGTAGYVLTSNGSAWTSATLPSYGTMANQNANNVAITGGTITGTTVNSVTVGTNASGAKTISTASPTGGSSGDVWYRVAS